MLKWVGFMRVCTASYSIPAGESREEVVCLFGRIAECEAALPSVDALQREIMRISEEKTRLRRVLWIDWEGGGGPGHLDRTID